MTIMDSRGALSLLIYSHIQDVLFVFTFFTPNRGKFFVTCLAISFSGFSYAGHDKEVIRLNGFLCYR